MMLNVQATEVWGAHVADLVHPIECLLPQRVVASRIENEEARIKVQ